MLSIGSLEAVVRCPCPTLNNKHGHKSWLFWCGVLLLWRRRRRRQRLRRRRQQRRRQQRQWRRRRSYGRRPKYAHRNQFNRCWNDDGINRHLWAKWKIYIDIRFVEYGDIKILLVQLSVFFFYCCCCRGRKFWLGNKITEGTM